MTFVQITVITLKRSHVTQCNRWRWLIPVSYHRIFSLRKKRWNRRKLNQKLRWKVTTFLAKYTRAKWRVITEKNIETEPRICVHLYLNWMINAKSFFKRNKNSSDQRNMWLAASLVVRTIGRFGLLTRAATHLAAGRTWATWPSVIDWSDRSSRAHVSHSPTPSWRPRPPEPLSRARSRAYSQHNSK